MTGDKDAVQRELDEVAEELVRRGMDEGGDFFVSGHLPLVDMSSEYVGLWRQEGDTFEVAYCDMGGHRVVVSTPDLAAARAAFVEQVLALGRGRGRGLDETGPGL